MSNTVDTTEISPVVAAAGVLIGVVYCILEMGHQTKAGQDMAETTQLAFLMRLYSTWIDEDLEKADWSIGELSFKDHEDFLENSGKSSVPSVWYLNGSPVKLDVKLLS